MAYRRNLTTRAKLYAQQRFSPSISYFHHHEDCKNQHSDEVLNTFPQTRSYSVFRNTTSTSLGFGGGGVRFRDPRWSRFHYAPMTTDGFLLARHFSTTDGDGSEADKSELMEDISNVLVDKTVEIASTQAPAVSEVAAAAADSWMPVAALQYAIDGIHSFTGLNWWACIAITTIVVRSLTIPVMIHQIKALAKLNILQPEWDKIKQEMQDGGMSPTARAEGREKLKGVFKQHGVSVLTPFKGILIQGPLFVSFYLAIENMLEKVPSFKTGGTSWFLDLTTADPFFILPCLCAFTFWLVVEFNGTEDKYSSAGSRTMKKVLRVFAALCVPFTAFFPKALFFYWITSNLFSLVHGKIMKIPGVRKMLNIPIVVPPPPPPGGESPGFSFDAKKKSAAAEALRKHQASQTNPTATKLSMARPSLQSKNKNPSLEDERRLNERESKASGLSQRIKGLEKEVKGRKKRLCSVSVALRRVLIDVVKNFDSRNQVIITALINDNRSLSNE